MECAKRAFKRKAFCPLKPISVAFVDAYNISEGVVDNGGPTREFFRLLVKEATASHIFDGPPGARTLALSTQGKKFLILSHPIQGADTVLNWPFSAKLVI